MGRRESGGKAETELREGVEGHSSWVRIKVVFWGGVEDQGSLFSGALF